jgi:hypothetical protein
MKGGNKQTARVGYTVAYGQICPAPNANFNDGSTSATEVAVTGTRSWNAMPIVQGFPTGDFA